jgi:hypothetical protein
MPPDPAPLHLGQSESGRGPDVLARGIDIELTVEESKALRMASIYGTPPGGAPILSNAYAKLLAAERGAGHAV